MPPTAVLGLTLINLCIAEPMLATHIRHFGTFFALFQKNLLLQITRKPLLIRPVAFWGDYTISGNM